MPKKALSLFAVVMVIVTAAAILGCAPTQTTKKLTDEQVKAMRDSAQASYSIGQQYFVQRDFPAALRNFEASIAYDSTFYEAYIATGSVYAKMRDAGNAEIYYEKGKKVDPKKPKAYEGLGDLALSMGESGKAKAIYLEGLKQDSSLVDLYNGYAEAAVKEGSWAEAESVYKAAMRLFPEDQNVQRLWADFLFKQKRFKEAADALAPVIARFPKVMTLRQRLADAYIELKKYDEAVAQLDTVLQADPSDNTTLLRKGAVLMLGGKVKQAVGIFQELAKRDSTKAEYYAYLGRAQLLQGNTGAAETQLRKALAIQSNFGQAYFDLGDIRMRAADQKRGKDVTATSTANLKAAKALYEEANSYYSKAAGDPAYEGDARARSNYIDQALQIVNKELFIR
jgi:predicted Zn-dependent protease